MKLQDVMLNFDDFISKFTFNLFSKSFIEIADESQKFVQVFGLENIVNSLTSNGMAVKKSVVSKSHIFMAGLPSGQRLMPCFYGRFAK